MEAFLRVKKVIFKILLTLCHSMSSCHHIWLGAWRTRQKKPLFTAESKVLIVVLSHCVQWWKLCLIPPYPPSTEFSAFMILLVLWRHFCGFKTLSPCTYLQSSNPVHIQSSVKYYSLTLPDLSYPALLHLHAGIASWLGPLPLSRTHSPPPEWDQDKEKQFAVIHIVHRKSLY